MASFMRCISRTRGLKNKSVVLKGLKGLLMKRRARSSALCLLL